MDEQMIDKVKTLTTAAEAGLWGLALNALNQTEGAGAALALLGNVRSGKGEVLCLVRFHGGAVTLEGVYDSHGARSPLFNVTLTQAPDLASGAGGLH